MGRKPKKPAEQPALVFGSEGHAVEKMRELRGVLLRNERGRQSFYAEIDMAKNPERACNWEKHFKHGTCPRELAGYLESLIEQYPRPDRFVFARMETLNANCFDGPRAEGKHFSRRMFWESVKLLRGLGILSPVVTRDGREGLILAPHDSLCTRQHEGRRCVFVGFDAGTVLRNQREARGLIGMFGYQLSDEKRQLIWYPTPEDK
jgi:hypothetical protein